ncbi:MAG TPA: hypothetical protein VK628_04760 [Flavitalea sp.]|nr:hypothetical protein [Flavitalea sp.]
MAKAKKAAPAKYTDKSAGQPLLVPVFDKIRKLLKKYAKGNFRPKSDRSGIYELYYDAPVEIAGVSKPELPFAGAIIQKGYVGFYFFPVYIDHGLKEKLEPTLLATLKGKTCFYIREDKVQMYKNIGDALEKGNKFFASRGWV